jgi:hypothetical protein
MLDRLFAGPNHQRLAQLRPQLSAAAFRQLGLLLAAELPADEFDAAVMEVLAGGEFTAPGLPLHITLEPHTPASQGFGAYGPFATTRAARAAAAAHCHVDPDEPRLVVTLDLLGAAMVGAWPGAEPKPERVPEESGIGGPRR